MFTDNSSANTDLANETMFSKKKIFAAALCVFSTAALAAMGTQNYHKSFSVNLKPTANDLPDFAADGSRILAADAQNLLSLVPEMATHMSLVPFTPNAVDLGNMTDTAESILKKDPISAAIFKTVNFKNPKFTIEQAAAYIVFATERFPAMMVNNPAVNTLFAQIPTSYFNNNSSISVNSAVRNKADQIIATVLGLENQAIKLGIKFNSSAVVENSVQDNSLNLKTQMQDNEIPFADHRLDLAKSNMLKPFKNYLTASAAAFDQMVMQVGLFKLINAALTNNPHLLLNSEQTRDFITLREQIFTFANALLNHDYGVAQFALLMVKAEAYVKVGIKMSSKQRVQDLLPELARAFSLFKLNHGANIYQTANAAIKADINRGQASAEAKLLAKVEHEASFFINQYHSAPRVQATNRNAVIKAYRNLIESPVFSYLQSTLHKDDYYISNTIIATEQQSHFGKYLSQAKILARQAIQGDMFTSLYPGLNAQHDFLTSLFWIIRIAEDDTFAARIQENIDRALRQHGMKSPLAFDAMIGMVWIRANSDYVLGILHEIKANTHKINKQVAINAISRAGFGITKAIAEANTSAEDRVAAPRSKP